MVVPSGVMVLVRCIARSLMSVLEHLKWLASVCGLWLKT